MFHKTSILLLSFFMLAACQTTTDHATLNSAEAQTVTVHFNSYNLDLYELYAKQGLDTKPIEEPIRGMLYKPAGTGPFPGVVIFHGCGGVTYNERMWSRWYQENGITALIVDGFTPRGYKTTCTSLGAIKTSTRINDAFAGAKFLSDLPFVDKTQIGIMGYSNGAGRALHVVQNRYRAKAGTYMPNFAFSIPTYPECREAFGIDSSGYRKGPYGAPVLVLIGEADDWTLASSCLKLAELTKDDAFPIEVITYPGAHHGFDDDNQSRRYMSSADNWNNPSGRGATVQGNSKVTEQAKKDVLAYLRRLKVIK